MQIRVFLSDPDPYKKKVGFGLLKNQKRFSWILSRYPDITIIIISRIWIRVIFHDQNWIQFSWRFGPDTVPPPWYKENIWYTGGKKPYSKKLAATMDLEARNLIASAYKRTEDILKQNQVPIHYYISLYKCKTTHGQGEVKLSSQKVSK